MKKHLIVLSIVAGMFSGCRHAPPPAPPKMQLIPAHSFVRQDVADLNLTNDQVDRMFLRQELLIVYSQNHTAYTLLRNGLVLQSIVDVTSRGTVLGAPVVFKQSIIYPTNTTLEVYSHEGKKLREIDLQYLVRSPIIGNGSTLFMGVAVQQGGRILAIDPDKPHTPIVWQFLTDAPVSAAPAYFNGTLYVGTEAGNVIAAQEQGAGQQPMQVYRFHTAGAIIGNLQADKSGVYVPSTDTELYCLDLNTGKIKWRYFAQHPLRQGPTVTATRVYQAVPGVGLAALDKLHGRADRQPLWIAHNVAQILSEDDQCVYTRLDNNAIAAIDKQTGKQLFISHRHDFVAFATNTSDATIYAATRDGKIYAIKPVHQAGGSGILVLQFHEITVRHG